MTAKEITAAASGTADGAAFQIRCGPEHDGCYLNKGHEGPCQY